MRLNIWGIASDQCSSESVGKYLWSLPESVPRVDWVWKEMDIVWDFYGLDNRIKLAEQPNIGKFYSHPVWIMNGLFTEVDPASVEHRKCIADFITKNKISKMADYGGGSGALASKIFDATKTVKIDIVEPYAFDFFKLKHEACYTVQYVDDFQFADYDLVVAQDVLEHVDNPIEVAFNIAKHVKKDGLIIFANCFYPVIKCHLPSTFYLRYTFRFVAAGMGLEYVGVVPGAEHSQVFKVGSKLSLGRALLVSILIKPVGELLNVIFPGLSSMKKKLKFK